MARRRPPYPRCVCNHFEGEHQRGKGACVALTGCGPTCDCKEFRKEGAIPTKRKRSIKKEAGASELEGAKIGDAIKGLHGERLVNTGRAAMPDFGWRLEDESWFALFENKHDQRLNKLPWDALQQIESAIRGMTGAPRYWGVRLHSKPGSAYAARRGFFFSEEMVQRIFGDLVVLAMALQETGDSDELAALLLERAGVS